METQKKMPRCFQCPAPFWRRKAVMTGGIILQGFGLALLRSIDLGLDPCSCLTQGVSQLTHLSFGTCQVICQTVMFIAVIIFDLSRIGFGTVWNVVFLGYISDFFTWLFRVTLPAGALEQTAVRYVLLIPTLAVFLVGAAAYMSSGLGSSPYDAVPFIISSHVKKPSFRAVRIIWDVAFMVLGVLLGVRPGIVTVAVAFFCGPVVAAVQRFLTRTLLAEKA